MCESFPEVETCCGVVSIRIAMILIAVLSITTGALSLAVVEQKTDFNFKQAFFMYSKVSNYSDPRQAENDLPNLVALIITCMAFIFMFAGISLLFSTLTEQEGFTQIFVWPVFFNVIIGVIMVIAIYFECTCGSKCLLKGLDGLTLATVIAGLLVYFLMWYYFCCVANSYVLNRND